MYHCKENLNLQFTLNTESAPIWQVEMQHI